MEEFLLRTLPSVGIGGVLAVMMFYFYRKDSIESLLRHEALSRDFKQVVVDNSRVMTELVVRLKIRCDE